MIKRRKTATFLRYVLATPLALVLSFATNNLFAYNAGDEIDCEPDVLHSYTEATFRAKWCQECSDESLLSTNCALSVIDGECVWDGGCLDGYENIVNPNSPNMRCSPAFYAINYYYVNDADNSQNPTQYTINDEITFYDITRDGYDFNGWYSNANAAQAPVDPAAEITKINVGTTGNKNLYASWTPHEWQIEYACANGDDAPAQIVGVTYGENARHTVPRVAEKCSYSGYTSNGWKCTTANGLDVSSRFVERDYFGQWDIDSNVLCVAQWTPVGYNIVYKQRIDGVDQTLDLEPQTFTMDDLPLTITAVPNARTGMDFAGWCRDSSGNNCVENPVIRPSDVASTNTITYWAGWTPMDYEIVYHLDGGTNNPNNPDTYNITQDVYLLNPTRDGYLFDGWYNYYDENDGSIDGWLAGDRTGVVTLRAKWQANGYSIEYNNIENANWDTGALHPNQYTITTETFTIGKPNQNGYRFVGWCRDVDNCVNPIANVTVERGSTGNIQLYAQWEPIVYSIIYHNAADVQWPVTANHPDAYTIKSETFYVGAPIRSGYSFGGWCRDVESCYNPELTYRVQSGSYGDIHLYSQWNQDVYNITYVNVSDSFIAGAKKTYNINESFTLDTPSQTGFAFDGWCRDIDSCNSPQKTIIVDSGTTGDLVFYAQWTPIKYNIYYQCQSGGNVALNDSVIFGTSYQFVNNTNYNGAGNNLCARVGSTFDSWKCNKYGDTGVIVPSTAIANWNMDYDVTCVAQWTENTFNVTFNSNSSYVSNPNAMSRMVCPYGVGCEIPNNEYTYFGHVFVGWTSDVDNNVYASERDAQNNTSTALNVIKEKTSDVVLSAQWKEAEIWCDKGTYLPADAMECAPCPESWYCPESRLWTFNPIDDQGKKYCVTLMRDNAATSAIGSRTTNDCYIPCPKKDGYILNPDSDKLYYGTDGVCIYDATVTYTGDAACENEPTPYSFKNEIKNTDTVNLCVPETQIGKTFIGWIDNVGNKYNVADNPNLTRVKISGFEPVNGVVPMRADWGNNKHSLVYDCAMGDKKIVVDDLEYNESETLIGYDKCNNNGYVFDGWLCNGSLMDAGEDLTMPDADVYCKAQIAPVTYNIVFDGNDADDGNTPNMMGLSFDQTYQLNKNKFEKHGYEFVGWCDDWDVRGARCVGKTYADNQSVSGLANTEDATITLYAMWKPIQYTITYRLPNGATVTPANQTYYFVTTPTFTLTNPTLSGYEFVGWCRERSGCSNPEMSVSVERGTTGNLVFVATMNPVEYNIYYKYTNAHGQIIDITGLTPTTYVSTRVSAYPTNVSIPGYTFVRWYLDRGLRYPTSQTSLGSTGDITVYAKVIRDVCGENYHLVEGECVACPDHSYSDGGDATKCECVDGYEEIDGVCVLKPIAPICDENQFVQNNECVACPEHSHSNGGGATKCECDEYYREKSGVCELIEWNINYVLNGGTLPDSIELPNKYTIETENFYLSNPTKNGYQFAGWYNNANLSGARITMLPGDKTGNITVYAKWAQETTIDFDCGNGQTYNDVGLSGRLVDVPKNDYCEIARGELVGWACDNGVTYELDKSVVVDRDIKCDAKISVDNVVYNIIYRAFGKDGNEIDLGDITPNTYTPSASVVYPTKITVAGYDFAGWYLDRRLRYPTSRTTLGSTNDVTVYAKLLSKVIHCEPGYYLPAGSDQECALCRPGEYCGGGDFPYDDTEDQGTNPCEEPFIDSDAGATTQTMCYKNCDAREHYQVTGLAYYGGNNTCVYTPIEYRIDYELGDGGYMPAGVLNYTKYTIETPNITVFPTPLHANMVFDKWLDENGNGIEYLDTSLARDRILHAQWKPKPCEANYYMKDGACNACPDGMRSDGGYAVECDCVNGYEKVSSGCAPIVYNITYTGLNGATNNNNPTTYTVNDAGRRIVAPGIRNGYTFVNWTRDGVVFDQIIAGVTGDITLVANWQVLSCTTRQFVENNTCVACPDNSHSAGGTATSCECNEGYDIDSDNQCALIDWPIRYYDGDVELTDTGNPSQYNIKTPRITLVAPQKKHYAFVGWYTNPDLINGRLDYINPATKSGAITLYAKWQFVCESDKWLHIGNNDKICLYKSDDVERPAMAIDIKNGPYYIMLSDDANMPINGTSNRKMHVEYNGGMYNAHDASAIK